MLADTLSALRQLILDDLVIPPDQGERLALYTELFPKLKHEELVDLSLMPPDRIRTYTNSIFSGERGLLKNHFPLTFAMLERFSRERLGTEFDGYRFVRELHASCPWIGTATADLARSFIRFLEQLVTAQRAPEGSEAIAEFEFLRLQVSRAPNSPCEELPRISDEAFSEKTVDELLELSVAVSSSARLHSFEYDVHKLFTAFVENGRSLPAQVALRKAPSALAASRSSDFLVFYTPLSQGVFELLQSKTRDEFFPVTELAEVCIADSTSGDDIETFRTFYLLLRTLETRGALFVIP